MLPITRRVPAVLLLVVTLLAGTTPVDAALPPGGTFMDDNGSQFEGAIEAIYAAGITTGCAPDLFCPDGLVTRAQMATFLSRARHLPATSTNFFTDDAGNTHEANINKLAAAGITTGCATKKFCPNGIVTRGQMATFLARAFKLHATSTDYFTDDAGNTHEANINKLAAAGITSGCGTNKFCPNGSVTRGQMAAFLQRALELSPIKPPPPVAGNPDGHAPIPAEARAADTSHPTRVVGNGTAASCTSAAVVNAVAQGGIITFNCGPNPVTIKMGATAKVFNNKPDVVLDGGGKVTLDGQGARRILYMNTCDQSLVWTTSHCQDQDHPNLTVQNITFANGRSTGNDTMDGGGAIFVRGGRFKVVNAQFHGNRCAPTGPDIGGAALQVFSQYQGRPVYIVGSTFGGAGDLRNECSNGGAISSIGVSWTILNSLFLNNRAIGTGANPPKNGKPGGGNGGAIYNDGNEMTLHVEGTRIEGNYSNHEGGSAIFFVSNNKSGFVEIVDSVIRHNTGDGFQTYPSIFFIGKKITFTNSVVQ